MARSDGHSEGDGNIAPIGAGATGAGRTGGSGNEGTRPIPQRDLHDPQTGRYEGRGDVQPYAEGSNTAAKNPLYEGFERNTAAGHGRGAVIDTGEFTNDSSLDVPGSVEPYANEARRSARFEDARGE